MNNVIELSKVKEEKFGIVNCDFYRDENSDEVFMTAEQLGEVLEYANPRTAINTMLTRNPYLRNKEFSTDFKLKSLDGKLRNTRVFNEDGIYEVTMLSNQPKAREFRMFVRKVIKELRRTGYVSVEQFDDPYLVVIENMFKSMKLTKKEIKEMKRAQNKYQMELDKHKKIVEQQQKNLDYVNKIVSVEDTATLRKTFTSSVQALALKKQIGFPVAYGKVYGRINKNQGINLKARAKKRNMKIVEYLEQENMLEYAMRIVNDMLNNEENAA